jgi:hypothetical protein
LRTKDLVPKKGVVTVLWLAVSPFAYDTHGSLLLIFLSARPVGSAVQGQLMGRTSNAKAIMCVDDEATGLSVRKMILESQGYRVFIAENGPDALVLFSSERQPRLPPPIPKARRNKLALLGERRCRETGQRSACGPRQNEFPKRQMMEISKCI